MGTTAITVLAVACGGAGLGVLAWWVRRHAGRVGRRAILVSVAAVGAAWVLAFGVVVVADSRWAFPIAHLTYLVATAAVPLVALAVLALVAIRRGRASTAVVAAVLLVPAPVGWYASHVAPYRLRVDRAEVALPAERAGTDPVRVGVFADLQATRITAYEQRAVDTLMAEAPDVILIAGDLFQGSDAQFDAELDAFRDLLGGLHAPGGVYAVRGDTDTGDRMDRLTEGTDIDILDDRIATVEVGDRTVHIGGNRLLWAPPEPLAVRRSLGDSDPGDLRILLAHRPEVIFGVEPDVDIDLTVAGHTHGGQVALPGLGPLVTFTSVPRRVAAGGLHEVEGHELYVSSGIGMVRLQAPQIRLFTRPSVGVVTLRS